MTSQEALHKAEEQGLEFYCAYHTAETAGQEDCLLLHAKEKMDEE